MSRYLLNRCALLLRRNFSLRLAANPISFVLLLGAASTTWAENIEISGSLETEIGRNTDFQNNKSSAINQATVEINLAKQISPSVSANITLLYEDNGGNPLNVDAAYVRLNPNKNPFSLQFGLQYLPFGWMETYMVSDPLTLELAETNESAVVFAYEDGIYAKLYIANGDVYEMNSDKTVGHFGLSVGYISAIDGKDGVDIGFDYTNNIGDTNNAGAIIAQDPTDPTNVSGIGGKGEIEKFVAGGSSHLGLHFSPLHFLAELVYAGDTFLSPRIRANDAKPSAVNVELAIDIGNNSHFAFGGQSSVDMEAFGVPAKRALIAYTTEFENGIGLGMEYRHDQDYGLSSPNGTGNSASGVTIQFSAAF